ncbi:hypothetical protein [Streptomyces sp. BBFR102]|uniref:hypothetical protein n=1 Tax=Streptomyces sp. BBFR102 TaxID=3448171 RepID=UPI003F52BD6E
MNVTTTAQELPQPTTLANEQLRGAACVWCGERLDTAMAVDLGARPDPAYSGVRWYPRACPACAEARS